MTQLEEIKKYVAERAAVTEKLARDIWGYAELAYNETKSSAALIKALEDGGFTVERGIAEIPTAFKATFTYGNGSPVMGFLAEYDALDGLSQEASLPEKKPLCAGGAGHGCGHNLLGSASFAAACAVKDYLVANKKDGTVAFFGCPAEEGAGSKQFIARAGYFDDVDFCYCWHPGTINEVACTGNVAIMGANFVFDGIASHAGAAPHLGRSALDACELMNVGVNYLREHMIDQARIHYAYSEPGGTAPNVVPSHAVIKYEVRAPKVNQMQELFARVVDVARGAALMTGTQMNFEVTMAFSDYVPNKTLAFVMDQCFRELGAPDWTEEDYDLARRFLYTYPRSTLQNIREDLVETFGTDEEVEKAMLKPIDSVVHPYDPAKFRYQSGSTDVGDVGYATPTAEVNVAMSCLGCVGHSWQWTSFANSDMGMKGMLRAAEVMALSSVRTMDDGALIARAKAELKRKNGGKYACPLPDYAKPPIGRY